MKWQNYINYKTLKWEKSTWFLFLILDWLRTPYVVKKAYDFIGMCHYNPVYAVLGI